MKNLTKISLIIALGVILPQVLGHLFGVQGTWLLPMHFCVVLAGITIGPIYAAFAGLVILSSSFFLTGMPAVLMLPQLAAELAILGILSGILSKKMNIYVAIILSYIIARFVFSCVFLLFLPPAMLYTTLTQGLIGLTLQVFLVPIIAFSGRQSASVSKAKVCFAENKAKKLIKSWYSLVVISAGKIVFESKDSGLKPLISASDRLGGAYVVDKIIGKAAAVVLTYYNVGKVYSDIMSETAIDFFQSNNVLYEYNKKIKTVKNKTQTDLCPMERMVADIKTAEAGYQILVNN